MTGNLTSALTGKFGPVAVAIVSLITFRYDLRARLRRGRPPGVPLLTEGTQLSLPTWTPSVAWAGRARRRIPVPSAAP